MAKRRADGRSTTGRPRRAYTIRDQVALRRLQDFVVSPDGSRLILQIESAVPGKNRLDTHLWSVGADGTGLRRLTRSGGRESNPAFAPDGRSVYFLAGSHTGDRRVVRLAFEGGKPIPVTRSPVDIESFVLSRDGAHHWRSRHRSFPGGPDTLGSTAERLKADARRPTSGQVHDRLFVRHWDQWKTGRRRHLFVQHVDGGPAVDVMPDMDADAPSKPFGGAEQYTFTPDGRGIVFTARDAGREEAWSTDLDLFEVPIDAARRRGSSRRTTGRPTRTRRSAPTGRCWPTWRWTGPATRPTS